MQRSVHLLPKNGSRAPWQLGMNYAHDLVRLLHGRIRDAAMRFSSPDPAEQPSPVPSELSALS